MLSAEKKDNENKDRLFRRFNRSIQMSGILREIKAKRYKQEEPNRTKRRKQAIRESQIRELRRKKREGY